MIAKNIGVPPIFAPEADDRADLDPAVKPGRPTLAALRALWRDRDVNYAKLTKALEWDQVVVIRAYRTKEVGDLVRDERARGWAAVKTWVPPQHGQGTGNDRVEGLRSWL